MKDETFLDLRARLTDVRGLLNIAMGLADEDAYYSDQVARLAAMVGHLGSTLQRVHLQTYHRPVED